MKVKLRGVIKIVAGTAALLVTAAAGAVAVAAGPAPDAGTRAETSYFTTRGVLAELFPKSEKVAYRTYALDASKRARLAQRLGYQPPRDSYTIFIATTKGNVDGYAIVDDEKGLHQPITFATRLSPRGIVERVEIMVYREPRGDEVRDARFRKQFEGKTAHDPLRLNRDIDAISGATISSASLATGVRRAAILVEELALGTSTVAAANRTTVDQ